MLDFFDYSGVSVQASERVVDLARPASLGFDFSPQRELQRHFDQQRRHNGASRLGSRPCNLYATAKVGTPNMIFPSTLDVSLRNFQDRAHYVQLCDHFFPGCTSS